MKHSSKIIFYAIAVGAGVLTVSSIVIYHHETTDKYTTTSNSVQSTLSTKIPTEAATTPTPEFLAAHLDTFKAAQAKCQKNSAADVGLCDNVRKAGALMLAAQYGGADSTKSQ